jgi:GH15 family glucan-1,4-alpha-glucosidase
MKIMNSPPLSDYALIGNSHSAALVCKTGAIEWCCLPEFHSPSIFASILDREKGGFFSIAPVRSMKSVQRYLPETNVVETYFEAEEGAVRIIDGFAVSSEEAKKTHFSPEHEILRVVEGVSGDVGMRMEYSPRSFYGKHIPRLEDRKKFGIHFCTGENIYTLLSTLEPQQILLSDKEQGKAMAEFSVKAGERVIFSLSYSSRSPAVLPEIHMTGWKRMNDTIRYWKEWIGHCQYSGLYEQEVRRSALVLKLLTHAPSGAIIAAPTTSIPEEPGGVRNWDYRFCWLRDASFTVNVLISLGFEEEAHAYMNWILHATQLTRPRLQVLYSVYGLATLKEKSLNWLSGYKDSRPVRIGNGADGQFQLDVYGEVLDAVYLYSKLVTQFDRDTKKFILGLGKAICDLWDKPDNGIWEVRSYPVHHTHSKAMAWIGLDRLIKLSEKYHWKDAPLEKFRKIASVISEEIERCGYNDKLESYTREFNGNTLDGSLLTMSLMGYTDPKSPRMMSTSQLIFERLSKNNMIYRYLNDDDGLPGDEGSFGVCNFWLAQNFAKSGKLEKAMELFEAMLKHASPAGLFSEEIDPDTHELLGNYPQGFTHIGLISAALCINNVYLKGEDKV